MPTALVLAIIEVESQGIADAIAHNEKDSARGGSYGLMQMSYNTAVLMGYHGSPSGLCNPAVNIQLGTRYLADLLTQTHDNIAAAISGYNGGLSRDRPDDGKRIGNTHTDADLQTPFINQDYVNRVLKAFAEYSA